VFEEGKINIQYPIFNWGFILNPEF